MPSLVIGDGFELGNSLYGDGNMTSTGYAVQGTTKRTGNYALQHGDTDGRERVSWAAADGASVLVGSCYFRYGTLALAAVTLYGTTGFTSGDEMALRISSAGVISAEFYDASAGTWGNGQTGPTLSADTWYLLDWKMDMSSGTWTIDWKVNGTAQTQATFASGGSGDSTWGTYAGSWSHNISDTHVMYTDDYVASVTAGDYPLGAHEVYGYFPNAVGTHNLDAATSEYYFYNSGGSDTAITTSDSTTYQQIDQSPLDGSTDYVVAKAKAGGTNYIDPSADGANNAWTKSTGTAGWSLLDEGTRSPTAPSTGTDRITSSTDEQMQDLVFPNTLTYNAADVYTLYIYGIGGTKRALDVQISTDDGASWGTRQVNVIAAGAAAAWVTIAHATLGINSQTKLDQFRVRLICNSTAGGGGATAVEVDAVYLQQVAAPIQPANTYYLEYGLQDNTHGDPLIVTHEFVGNRGSTGTTVNISAKQTDGTNETAAAVIYSGSALETVARLPRNQDPGGGAWSDADLDGLKLRIGYTNTADGGARVKGIGVQAAFAAGSGPQTVAITGKGSAAAFGTPTMAPGGVSVSITGLGSAASIGTPTVVGITTFAVTGLGSAAAFGTTALNPGNVNVAITGLGSAAAYGSPTMVPGTVTVAITGLGSAAAFGTTQFNTRTPITGLGSAAAFGTTALVPGVITASITGLGSAAALGSPTMVPGVATVSITGLGSAAAFGTAQFNTVTQITGLTGTHQFGTAVWQAVYTVPITGLGSAAALGTPTMAATYTISVTGLGSAAAFGAPTVNTTGGPQNVAITGLGSAAAFGTTQFNVTFAVTGLGSAAAFGAPTLAPGAIGVAITGLGSAASFGAPTLVPGTVTVAITGLGSAAAIGTVGMAPGGVGVDMAGLGSAAAFGSPTMTVGTIFVAITGLGSAAAFGSPTLAPGALAVEMTGLGSAAQFGTPEFDYRVYMTGLDTAASFGTPNVNTSGSPQNVPVTGLGSAASFGSPIMVPGVITVSITGLTGTHQFGTLEFDLVIPITGLAAAHGFGAAVLSGGAVVIPITGLDTAANLPTPSVTTPGGGNNIALLQGYFH